MTTAHVHSPPFGTMMRDWRQRRRLSQLDLAIEAFLPTDEATAAALR